MRNGTISWVTWEEERKSQCLMRQWRSFTGCWGGGCWGMTVLTGATFCITTLRLGLSLSSFSTRSQWENSREKCLKRKNLLQLNKSRKSKSLKMANKTTKTTKTQPPNKYHKHHPPNNRNNPNNPNNSNPKSKPSNKVVQKSNPTSHKPSSRSSEWASTSRIRLP